MYLKQNFRIYSIILLPLVTIFIIQACSSGTEWKKVNEQLISEFDLTIRKLEDLPNEVVPSNLETGIVTPLSNLDSVNLHPGINGKLFWGIRNMVCIMNMEPNSEIPEEHSTCDRFVFVLEGSITQKINGSEVILFNKKREAPDGVHSGTPKTDFVYMQKGTSSGASAGESGAKILEVSSPLNISYLKKAGMSDLPDAITDVSIAQTPNVEPNKVYDLYDFQLTELASGAYSRLISGRNMQLSFISMEPGSVFPHHIHPEEQMMLVLRGACKEILLDTEQEMEVNSVVRIPGNMVHGAIIGELGCDALDLFWPVRADYSQKENTRMAAFHKIIPEGVELELLVDGSETSPQLYFCEGPKWMNGKVYFSNMYFDANWNADPRKSSTVELNPDGSYRNITAGTMQTNGLYPFKNGNLLVCDMIGHRVVEMTTEGRVIKVIADQYNGKAIDGPNDIVTDARGGIYFTDPQFTMEAEKSQPGRAVYYISPKGKINRLLEPNEFAMPNGILLSPNGKTLYINNCYDDESWYPVNSEKNNYIWAYDVNKDGTISNGRQFAKLFLTGDVLDRKAKSSSADGMAIDKEGHLYVATYYGVQIFDSEGEYMGMINLPTFPVSLCFGDEDLKTLYIVSYNKIYKIRTNMEGFVQYL